MLLAEDEKGKPVPALDALPDLPDECRLAWTAFSELSAQRQQGFAPSPIALHDMVCWMDLNDIEPELRLVLYDYIRALDSELLAHSNKEASKNAKSKSGNQR